MHKKILYGLLLLLTYSCNPSASEEQDTQKDNKETGYLFAGTYTKKEGHVDGKGAGIYTLNARTFERLHTTEGIVNPSFLTSSPDGKTLYAVSEIGTDVDSTGFVYAYAIQEDGSLRFLNRQSSHGLYPCHLAVHPNGSHLYVANYMEVIAAYPLAEDGSIKKATFVEKLVGSTDHPRQEAAHPHSVNPHPDGKQLYVADLASNLLRVYSIEQDPGQPQVQPDAFFAPQPQAGPRHLTFSRKGNIIYLLNELNSSINVLQRQEDGSLKLVQTITALRPGFTGKNLAADIHCSADGQLLITSNRGDDNSLAVFDILENAQLQLRGHLAAEGKTPRNFWVDPLTGNIVIANQDSGQLVHYATDTTPGVGFTLRKKEAFPTPVCLHYAK